MQKTRTIISLLILLVIILASIITVQYQEKKAAALPYTIGTVPANANEMASMGMVMKTFRLPATEPVPVVAMTITEDSMDGWDVHVITTNFTFTPQNIGGNPVPGEGHVHLYVDGHLIIMLGDWYHIDALTPGTHTITAGLFNNDHSAYAINGTNIETTQTLTVQ